MEAAFIFDMDGVIVDSNPAHKIALKEFCRKYGKELTEDELREKIYGRRNQDWLVNIFGPLSPEKMKAYADEKEALFRKIYAADIEPLPGLREFLERLESDGAARAIATSAPRSNVDFTLEKTGLGRFFSTILDDSHVEKGKPDPDVYVKSARALGFKPAMCVVFEDSLAGVKAGKSAGCKVVGVTTTHSDAELAEADLIIGDFQGLDPKQLINKMF